MDVLDVFRATLDGSFLWIGSADSLKAAHEMFKACTVDASEEFLIYNPQTNERITLRADRDSMRSTC